MKVLGIDLGRSSIKAILVQKGLTRIRILRAFDLARELPTPEASLAELMRQVGVVPDVVVLSLPRETIVTRNISLPFKDARKIRMTFASRAEGCLPFSLGEARLDYHVADASDPTETRLVVFAVKYDDLENSTRWLDGLNIPERFLMVDSLAAVNAYLSEFDEKGSIALIDVGLKQSSVEVLHDGRLRFSRSLGIGGDHFTQALMESLKLEREKAERLKRSLGDPEGRVAAEIAQRAEPALVRTTSRFVQQVRVSLMAAKNLWPDLEVRRIHLTGNGSSVTGLAARLGEELGLEAGPLHLGGLDGVPGVSGDRQPAAAYGLALYGLNRGEIRFDLLGRPRNLLRLYRKNILAAAVVMIVYMIWSFSSYHARLGDLTRQRDAHADVIQRTLARAESALGRRIAVKDLEDTLKSAEKKLEVLARNRGRPLEILNLVTRQIPPGVNFVINHFDLSEGTVTLKAQSDSLDSALKIEKALKALDSRIVVDGFQTSANRNVTFRIQLPADREDDTGAG